MKIAICVLLVAVAGALIFYPRQDSSPPTGSLSPTTGASTTDPPAWHFDAANNRHWDPGHNHWHDGPPPPESARGAPASITPTPVPTANAPGRTPPPLSPEPWQYDAANNQHWDPAHQHWHGGPPPPESER